MSFRRQGIRKPKKLSTSTRYKSVKTESSPGTSRDSSPTAATETSIVDETLSQLSDPEPEDPRTDAEKELFELVAAGDGNDIREFLQTHPDIRINVKNTENNTVLYEAVKNEDANLVEMLCSFNYGIDTSSAMQYAIQEELIEIVTILYDWNSVWEKEKPSENKSYPVSLYPDGFVEVKIPAFVEAAKSGHYSIIKLLYDKGERLNLEWLHLDNNLVITSTRNLIKSKNRIAFLHGISNPGFLAFMAGEDKLFDPVMISFKIVKKIETLMNNEPDFSEEYQKVLDEIKKFPVDLLSMCKSQMETEVFLKNRVGYQGLSKFPYPRLQLALDLDQREFVAHKRAQDILYKVWVGGDYWVPESVAESILKKLYVIGTSICFPIISIFLLGGILMPKNRIVKKLSAPVCRCRANVSSYLLFLTILFFMNSETRAKANLEPPPFYLPWIIALYFLCHLMTYIRHFLISPKHFFRVGWNIFELFTLIFFMATIALWIVVYFKHHPTKYYNSVERGWLDPYDVLLISEVVTGITSTLAGLKFLRNFVLHSTLGPLQISFGKMTRDIMSFVVFFATIILSFSLGAQHLYGPYGVFAGYSGALKQLPSAMLAFFWGIFTGQGSDTPKIEAWNINEAKNVTNHHMLSQSAGKLIFVAFHILCVTCLMNMLTGFMSANYKSTIEKVDVEWKSERSRMWIYYFNDSVFSPPLNLISNGIVVLNLLVWIRSCTTKEYKGEEDSSALTNCCLQKDGKTLEERKAYKRAYRKLIQKLLQRYFRNKIREKQTDAPSKEDIDVAKLHVMQLRTLAEFTLEQTSNNSLTNISQSAPPDSTTPPPPPPPPPNEVHSKTVQVLKSAGLGVRNKTNPPPTNNINDRQIVNSENKRNNKKSV